MNRRVANSISQWCVAAAILLAFNINSTQAQIGDFDQNGIYDCADVNRLSVEIIEGSGDLSFDMTGDGIIDIADQLEWLAVAGAANLTSGNSYLWGDANLDGFVDISDFNIWNDHKFTVNPNYCDGNFNADIVVDASDFMVWNSNKFTSSRILPPGGSLDDLISFTYDTTTGVLTMDTNGIGVNCFSIFTSEPLETMDLGSGYTDENGTLWIYSFFESQLKWMSNDTTDTSGYFELARLEPGLTADDFGTIGFMNQAMETGTTTIEIVSSSVVPEPNSMVLAGFCFASLLGIARRFRGESSPRR